MTIQYVFDDAGRETAVLIPIQEWRTILDRLKGSAPERDDTEHLLSNPVMRERLLGSLESGDRMTWEEVRGALGL